MMCQTTTSAVSFMCYYWLLLYKLHCRFQGAETPNKLAAAFQALGDLLHCLGLSTSLKKDSPPATLMVFLGVLVNATEMTISITTDCLSELHSHCASLLSVTYVSQQDLQPLLGIMFFVTPCVRPPPMFLCCHCFTPSDHTGCLNTALFQVLITLIYAGSVTSYHTTMVSRSLRLCLGWTIISSSPRTYAAPLHMCSNVNVSL